MSFVSNSPSNGKGLTKIGPNHRPDPNPRLSQLRARLWATKRAIKLEREFQRLNRRLVEADRQRNHFETMSQAPIDFFQPSVQPIAYDESNVETRFE